MSRTLTFTGSHGAFTCCAISGHIIAADACDCDDCARFGSYQSIALVDVAGSDPANVEAGGGDILAAALVYRDGGYMPAMGWDDDSGWTEPPLRLAGPESVQ
jgi:hypothetical protein